jgi:hypothetical protein
MFFFCFFKTDLLSVRKFLDALGVMLMPARTLRLIWAGAGCLRPLGAGRTYEPMPYLVSQPYITLGFFVGR